MKNVLGIGHFCNKTIERQLTKIGCQTVDAGKNRGVSA